MSRLHYFSVGSVYKNIDIGNFSIPGDFKIVNDFRTSSSSHDHDSNKITVDVSLVTQASVNNLHHLLDIVSFWSGPISVASFLPDANVTFAAYIVHTLRRCFFKIQQSVSFHLVYPLHRPVPPKLPEKCPIIDLPCGLAMKYLKQQIDTSMTNQNYNHKVPYPVNILRNVARRNVKSRFIFVIDIDMLPNTGLYENLVSFYAREISKSSSSQIKLGKTVYVVPAFEIRNNISRPVNKKDLITLYRSSSHVRPFYYEMCEKCQKSTDYEAWMNHPPAANFGVAYDVLWKDPWEPFYISEVSVPFYDERFKQYGFNRISQVNHSAFK